MYDSAALVRLADAELLKRAVEHDGDAADALFNRHAAMARTLVQLLARDHADHDALVAEAFRHTFYSARMAVGGRIDFLGALSASIRAITGAGLIPSTREPEGARRARARGLLLAV